MELRADSRQPEKIPKLGWGGKHLSLKLLLGNYEEDLVQSPVPMSKVKCGGVLLQSQGLVAETRRSLRLTDQQVQLYQLRSQ